MKKEMFNRFNIVMANLKTIEPSPYFDFEFKRKLKEAMIQTYEESALEKVARKISESIRYVLLPQIPALVRVMAAFTILVSFGLYSYSIQPTSPISTAKNGFVLVRSVKDVGWKELKLADRIKVGDVITTGKDSQLDMVLPSKYAIRVKENAKFKIARLTPRYGKGKADFQLIEGRMLVSIDEGFKGSNFIVDTEAATAKALGTKFSVDVLRKDRPKTQVSVLEGKVEVKSRVMPERFLLAKQIVMVGAGQKTEVSVGDIPAPPQRLMEKDWRELEELYQIGKKPQVILLVKNTPDRAKQLLRPCPIYISDEKPREIPKLLEDALLTIEEAIKTQDMAKHLESIKTLERIVEEHPNPKYDVQLLLYIGAYYEYISRHREAIKTFEKVVLKYPDSPLVSIAQCAIGIIYEEKLNNMEMAREAYRLVLKNYPNSLEAIWADMRLGIKKVSKSY